MSFIAMNAREKQAAAVAAEVAVVAVVSGAAAEEEEVAEAEACPKTVGVKTLLAKNKVPGRT